MYPNLQTTMMCTNHFSILLYYLLLLHHFILVNLFTSKPFSLFYNDLQLFSEIKLHQITVMKTVKLNLKLDKFEA